MKKIEAVIRPEKLEQVSDALIASGYHAMTVTDVRGRGEQRGIALQYRGREILVNLIPKVKIEIVVEDRCVDAIVKIVKTEAMTGRNGDGKIFVYDIEKCITIRDAKDGVKSEGKDDNSNEGDKKGE
ncbi:P-II family nitrogen regulator [Methanomicrobium mobile]|uniref:P-II family nitrogen regulator n=1 Tax=Methanomicrobium mobile TaxID=2205 RepID=UPI0006943012|nr:P-II family nitrogen regulator [Methanomicrobium mobile]